MDVAGAVFDGLDEDQVGQLDDRGFLARGGELVQVDFFDRLTRDLKMVGLGFVIGPASARPG